MKALTRVVANHNEGTNQEGKELPVMEGSFFCGGNDEEAKKYVDEYVKRLEERYLGFEALLSSGYFLATIAIMSFVEWANSIINFPKSAHFFATS